MAITGNGTLGNPYVVHDYTEFKTVLQGQYTYWQLDGETIYLRTDDTIISTTWESMISHDNQSCTPHIDLNGHGMKINGDSSTSYVLPNGSYIINGKMILDGGMQIEDIASIYNVGIIINNGKIVRSKLNHCRIKRIAGQVLHSWIFTSKLTILSTDDIADSAAIQGCILECCDLTFNISYVTRKCKILYGEGNETYYPSHMYRCRLTGNITGVITSDETMEILMGGYFYKETYPWRMMYYYVYESLVSIDATQITSAHMGYHRMVARVDENEYQTYINADLLSSVLDRGLYGITETQITSGSELRAIGFPVINEVTT